MLYEIVTVDNRLSIPLLHEHLRRMRMYNPPSSPKEENEAFKVIEFIKGADPRKDVVMIRVGDHLCYSMVGNYKIINKDKLYGGTINSVNYTY